MGVVGWIIWRRIDNTIGSSGAMELNPVPASREAINEHHIEFDQWYSIVLASNRINK
jgi:hypothetical protein